MEVTFRPVKNPVGKIVAFADVVVTPGITVRGFKILDGNNGLFAAVPSRGFTADGKPRYYNLVTFADPERKNQFLAELLEDYDRWLETEGRTEEAAQKESEIGRTPF